MRSGQTEIEDQLREKMNLPPRSQLSERRDEVEVPPRIYTEFREGPCPKTVFFNAEFTLNRSETIRYSFPDETTPEPLSTFQIKADVGRNSVSHKRVVGVPGQKFTGWVQFELFAGKLHLTTPQHRFAVDC